MGWVWVRVVNRRCAGAVLCLSPGNPRRPKTPSCNAKSKGWGAVRITLADGSTKVCAQARVVVLKVEEEKRSREKIRFLRPIRDRQQDYIGRIW